MKQFVLLFIFILFIVEAKSQFNIYGKIGANYANLSTRTLEQKFLIGYQIGLSSTYGFSEKLILQPEILISLKGGELKYNSSNASDYFDYLETKKTYIDFPILLKYRITNNNKLDLYINAGINPGLCIWTKQYERGGDVVEMINGPDLSGAFGFIGGIGLDLFNTAALEFRYEYGITDLLGYSDDSYSNRVISLALTYKLSKRK